MAYILRGRAALNMPASRDSYAKAIGLFELVLSLDPGSVEAKSRLAGALVERANLGMTASAATDIARAEDLVGQALAASPFDPRAYYVKGEVLLVHHRPEEATFEFEAVLASNRNSIGALFQLGWCRARNANPVFSEPHFFLASAYALKGETGRAATELAEYRRLRGESFNSSMARIARGYWGVTGGAIGSPSTWCSDALKRTRTASSLLVFPAKAGIYFRHGHRPSPA
jgi:tetratricopeptide (TPR) repeat protein